jgi:hypothetical protein
MSGGIDLAGDFGTNADMANARVSVVLRLPPTASVHVVANGVSGGLSTSGLQFTQRSAGPHSLDASREWRTDPFHSHHQW